jgi:predicted ribosomally synthesized peptide with SipW-like signal peptide
MNILDTIKKNKKKAGALALVGLCGVGATMAYFTDADTATNHFTVGKVDIDLTEDHWDPSKDNDHDNTPDVQEVTPKQEYAKDPTITNTGKNKAYVFAKVKVPYRDNLVTANDNGTKNNAQSIELFNYDVNKDWIEITNPDTADGKQNDTIHRVSGDAISNKARYDDKTHTVTHLYAYATDKAMTVLDKNAKTAPVFEFIRFVNAVEDQNLETTALDVVVNGYAIQTTNINDGKTALDGNNTDGKTSPAEVWSALTNQAPSTEKDNETQPTDKVKLWFEGSL